MYWETGAPGVTACRTPHALLLQSEELMTCQGGGSGSGAVTVLVAPAFSGTGPAVRKALWDLGICNLVLQREMKIILVLSSSSCEWVLDEVM